MKTFNELNDLVIIWAEEKGIFEKATPLSQMKKTEEEIFELMEAITAQNANLETYVNTKGKPVNTKAEVKDGIGDSLVTLVIQAKMQGLTIEECLESAYNIISKRTGKMIDGQFVKDGE
jgi:NTP pyrophosphatase (non-canonical NTP hydrolase)